ncbi:MAG: 50S ribosomal protein L18 [Candidatus Nezhaarchaeales archaeon]
MVKATFKLPFRRRREGKSDYRLRRKLVLSGKPLLVVRRTNKNVIVQVIKPEVNGDRTLTASSSMEVSRRFKWLGSGKNTSAAYLTGYLAGLKAVKLGIEEAVLYVGLHRPVKHSRVFAALKGFIEAGIKVPHAEDVLPDHDRLIGKHIADYAKKLSVENPDLYKKIFSRYLAKGLAPELLPTHVEEVKELIRKWAAKQ